MIVYMIDASETGASRGDPSMSFCRAPSSRNNSETWGTHFALTFENEVGQTKASALTASLLDQGAAVASVWFYFWGDYYCGRYAVSRFHLQ